MFFYRYTDYNAVEPTLRMEVFQVVRETPCGAHIVEVEQVNHPDAKTRWVQNMTPGTGAKRFAYRNLADAWHSYRVRKRKELHHVQTRLERCQLIKAWLDARDLPDQPPILLPRANARGFNQWQNTHPTMGTIPGAQGLQWD